MPSEDRREISAGSRPPHIVVGITCAQTCLVLTGRLRALRAAGFRVTLVSSPGPLLTHIGAAEGIETLALPMSRPIAPLRDLVALFRLWRHLRRLAPDIVEFSTPKAGLLGMLAARAAGIRRRIYLLRGLKLETAGGLKRRILSAAEKLTCACAHTVLCNSASLRDQAVALGIASRARFRVLGPGSSIGVDVDRFAPGPTRVRSELGIPPKAPVIGFVGRLTRDKGLPELLTAFEAVLRVHPEAWLLLVGWFDAAEDALDPALRQHILAHPRILCTGFVADPAPYYRAMNMLVLPTLREGFPNAVLEASASGLPVVTTLSTGSRDAVLPELTGLLVPPGYAEAVTEAVLRLMGDEGLRRRMGASGRAWVVEEFASSRVLKLNVDFYASLLAHTPPRPATSPRSMGLAAPLR